MRLVESGNWNYAQNLKLWVLIDYIEDIEYAIFDHKVLKGSTLE